MAFVTSGILFKREKKKNQGFFSIDPAKIRKPSKTGLGSVLPPGSDCYPLPFPNFLPAVHQLIYSHVLPNLKLGKNLHLGFLLFFPLRKFLKNEDLNWHLP
ncbi:Hypothetical predicted protein [Marmota monax]|uniref:Uncharacterized protein n=1 Tax=Marmota monax TaxID=9995 RepID=A0A5E4AEL2_MARMO|nr:Hypothetical predicted protein [Marmota monax]